MIQSVIRQFFILLVIVIVVPPHLKSQTTSSGANDGFFLDLGIVIEPSTGDEEVNRLIKAPPEKVKLFIDKAPSGSVYMASTKELQETLARINHKIEGLQLAFQRQTENLQKENHELRDLINNLIDQVESPVQDLEVVVESTNEERNSQVEEANEAPEVVSEDENPPVFNRMLYMNAVFAYQREDYQTATRQFSDLAVEASDDITAGNVLYWMADCYFQLGQPSKALSILTQLDLFKESDKLDDSMILQGLAFRQLGEEEKAVAAFAGVVELYPESEYYRLAQMEYNRSLK